MKNRYSLLQRGLFPETLPPCFTSLDLKRSFRGMVPAIEAKKFHQKRSTDYVRYNGTKHDGSRRFFGTPNPISYFYVSDFIAQNWRSFEKRFDVSPFSVSRPKVAKEQDDRPVIIPSLSELTTEASKKLGHSPYLLKTDIAQFFPSIYTHSISWAAHGIEGSKSDTSHNSKVNKFNQLDFHVRNCQLSETRGVLVGPDAFRLVSEFIIAGIDKEINDAVGHEIVGAARHVDDYYIGLRSETSALVVLSTLRDKLQRYSLNINDSKTKILNGLEPLNDLWAQTLRYDARRLSGYGFFSTAQVDDIILFINKSVELARQHGTDSPVKIALRALDQIKIYQRSSWPLIEPYLQRIIFHHPHCIDYVALLVVKRYSLDNSIDKSGWQNASYDLIKRHLAFNHHHEIVWLLWILICCRLEIPSDLVSDLIKNQNAHIRSMIIAAYAHGLIKRKPKLSLGAKLPSADQDWLLNLVSRSLEFTKAKFLGNFAVEFEHLASKNVCLIDFDQHLEAVKAANVHAISRTRYGYDRDDDDDDDDEEPF